MNLGLLSDTELHQWINKLNHKKSKIDSGGGYCATTNVDLRAAKYEKKQRDADNLTYRDSSSLRRLNV